MQGSSDSAAATLAELRVTDTDFGLAATRLADEWRQTNRTTAVRSEFVGLSPFLDCYPAPTKRRKGVLRVLRAVWRRVALRVPQLVKVVDTLRGAGRVRTVVHGDWIMFVGVGALPVRGAIKALVLFCEATGADFAYGDSVHFDAGAPHHYVHQLRPGWSPERLISHCYVGTVVAATRAVVDSAGGVDALRRMSDHGRALALADSAASHLHVNVVLYRSRLGSAMPGVDTDAVNEHCSRTMIRADVSFSGGHAVVRRVVSGPRSVAVIVPTRGASARVDGVDTVLGAHALRALNEVSGAAVTEVILVVDSGTTDIARREMLLAAGETARVIDFDEPFNFARKVNLAAVSTRADYLLLMNDDTQPVSPGIVEHLATYLEDPDVSAVSPLLLFEDGTVQSAGHLLNPSPMDLYRGFAFEESAGWGMLGATREATSLIAAFLLVRRKDFLAVGGMCEGFAGDYNDVDFALKLALHGKRLLVVPNLQCRHFESMTRVPGLDGQSIELLHRRWGHVIARDPLGNRYLQPHEFVWKSNEDTLTSLDAAVGRPVTWDRGEWDYLQTLEEKHLHRTMYLPRWLRDREQ